MMSKFTLNASGPYGAQESKRFSYSQVMEIDGRVEPEADGQITKATVEVVRQFGIRMPNHNPIWTCLVCSGLLSRAHQDFADEALRRLRDERRNDRGDVARLQLPFRILT
jgi:hypothetical protein